MFAVCRKQSGFCGSLIRTKRQPAQTDFILHVKHCLATLMCEKRIICSPEINHDPSDSRNCSGLMRVDKPLARDEWIDFDSNWNLPVHDGHVMCDDLNVCVGSRPQSAHVGCQSCVKSKCGVNVSFISS